MIKEKRILSYFIGWLFLGLIVCFIGIKKTDALVIDSNFLGQSVNTNLGTQPNGYIQGNSYIIVDQSNALNYYVVDLCTTLGSSFNISNVSNQSGNVSHYKTLKQMGSCNTTNYDGTLSRIYFKINQWADAGNGNFGVIFTSRLNSTANYYSDIRILNIYTSDEVDNTSEIINNQTNELNNSINNSTNTITGSIGDAENNITQNIDDMEQSIVDSNKETQDVIKDQFNSCIKQIDFTLLEGKYFNQNGSLSDNLDYYYTSNYIELKSNSIIISNVENATYSRLLTYDENRNLIDWYSFYNRTFTFDSNVKYIRFSTISSSVKLEYTEEICSNKIDETNDKLDGIQGALTDSSAPNTSGLENSAGWLPPGPLDSVLNLPLSLFNALTTNLNKTCNPINIPLPYVNKNITLPCINTLYNQIGITSFLSWIGVIVSGLMLYTYLLKLYKWIEDRVSLNETHNVDSWGGL